MNQDKKTSLIVGITTFICITLFFAVVGILSRWNVGSDGFIVHVKYGFLNDVVSGAPVKLAGGIEVGYVKQIRQDGVISIVDLYLNPTMKDKIPLHPKTQFAIFTTGMMGQKYINLTVPTLKPEEEKGLKKIVAGTTLRGIDPPSIDQIMMSFSSWFDGKNGGQVLAEVIGETKSFISGLNQIVAENRQDVRKTVQIARSSLDELSVEMKTLMTKLNSMTTNLDEISKKNKEDIQLMLQNLSYVSKDLSVISKRIQDGKGTIGKLVNDNAFYQNLEDASIYAKSLFQKLSDKPHLLFFKK